MNFSVSLMMEIIKSEICNTPIDKSLFEKLSDDDISALYKVSSAHDLVHLVGYVLDKHKLIANDKYLSEFRKQTYLSVYRYENLNYEYNRICDLLAKHNVPFITLKGTVIRKYYPEPWMRTSSDIDLYIKAENSEQICSAIIDELGYREGDTAQNEKILYSPSNVILELHFAYDSNNNTETEVLQDAWSFTEEFELNNDGFSISNEYFYLHNIVHMAKHFEEGGCGVRPLIDVYLLDKYMKYDSVKLNDLCTKYGVADFFKWIKKLAGVWFDNEEHTELTHNMEDYILRGGVYGHTHSKTIVKQIRHGGKLPYMITKIWKPYSELIKQYPSLHGKKWLMPIYQMRRWGRLIFCGGAKKDIEVLGLNKNYSKAERCIKKMLSELGLK